jgi:Cu2+-containing amine oxidase
MPGETPKYGSLVAPQLNAPVHQHFFNVRLDMNLEGNSNSVYEVNTEAEPMGPENPHGNAFFPSLPSWQQNLKPNARLTRWPPATGKSSILP